MKTTYLRALILGTALTIPAVAFAEGKAEAPKAEKKEEAAPKAAEAPKAKEEAKKEEKGGEKKEGHKKGGKKEKKEAPVK